MAPRTPRRKKPATNTIKTTTTTTTTRARAATASSAPDTRAMVRASTWTPSVNQPRSGLLQRHVEQPPRLGVRRLRLRARALICLLLQLLPHRQEVLAHLVERLRRHP